MNDIFRLHLKVFTSHDPTELQKWYESWAKQNKNIITDVIVQFNTIFSNQVSIRYSVAVFFNLKGDHIASELKD